jgi:hypothetical protein
MSNLSTFIALLKNNLEVELLPVAIGGLQILQKSPNAAGIVAAEAYVLGNAPAALLAGETQVLQAGITDLQAQLAKLQAAAAAPAAPTAA